MQVQASRKKRDKEAIGWISAHHNFYLDHANTRKKKNCLEPWLTAIGYWGFSCGSIERDKITAQILCIGLQENLQQLRDRRRQRRRPETSRDWQDLPPEITTQILSRVDAIDLFLNAQMVCSSWFNLCKDPSVWRSLELIRPVIGGPNDGIERTEWICALAVDRSCGHLESVNIEYFCTDDLLIYIAERSPNLRRLRLFSCSKLTGGGFEKAAKRLRLLEDVEISWCAFNADCFGRFCPRLTSFKLNYATGGDYYHGPNGCIIGSTMPGLRHLQLLGFRLLSKKDLRAILDGCPHLESLDLRNSRHLCFGNWLPDRNWSEIMSPEEYSESEIMSPEESELEMRCVAQLKEFWSWNETTTDGLQISHKEFWGSLIYVEHPYDYDSYWYSYWWYFQRDDDDDDDGCFELDEYDFYISHCTKKIKQLDFCIP